MPPGITTIFLPMAASRPGKVFMSTTEFGDLDNGNHSCRSAKPSESSKISFLHLHNKPFTSLRKSAKVKLIGRGCNVNDKSFLRTYRGPGWHLTRYLLMEEPEWLQSLQQQEAVECLSFARRFRELRLTTPLTMLSTVYDLQ